MTENELLAMAHRYLYYCHGRPVISEADELSPLNRPGSDSESSYSAEVVEIAERLSGG